MSTPAPAADRWDRLAADLAAAGIPARIDRRPYTETRYGRVVSGVTSSIFIRHPAGGSVEIDDKHGRGGKWYGWSVTRTGADSITIGRPTWGTKRRSEVVAAVQARLTCGNPGCDVTCAVNGCNPTCPCREPARQESNRGLGPRHPEDPR